MAKRKRYKLGEQVEFQFAGIIEKGEITDVSEPGRVTVYDGKYTYPISIDKITKVIK